MKIFTLLLGKTKSVIYFVCFSRYERHHDLALLKGKQCCQVESSTTIIPSQLLFMPKFFLQTIKLLVNFYEYLKIWKSVFFSLNKNHWVS